MIERLVVGVSLWCLWELISIPVAESGDEPVSLPLSLYQALVFNPRARARQS